MTTPYEEVVKDKDRVIDQDHGGSFILLMNLQMKSMLKF